jgi:1-acyl-sn-glycerol-3-phosphate acyltransferase
MPAVPPVAAPVAAPVPAKPWPVDAWTVLNSLCGYGSFILFCLTLPLFLPLALLLPGGRRLWIARAMRVAMRTVFAVTPTVSWRCDGDLAALAGARVVVANHEGMLDVLAACSLPGIRTFLAKTWVFRAFPLGIAARAAGLHNSDALAAEDYQEGAALTLPDPRVGLFVFPEGSRSRDGAIHRFRPGAFVLARHLAAPVVPVVVAGSRLGIRPGSLWIHPTCVHSRVLAPMRPQPEESHRQFAARVRAAIIMGHHRLMAELLGQGRLALHRRHRAAGLPTVLRRAVAAEEHDGAWRVLLELPRVDGDWLFLGGGWGAMPLTVRLLQAAAAVHLVETDGDRLVVARHLWLQDSDRVVAEVAEVSLDGITTAVCTWDAAHPQRAEILARLAQQVPRLVVQGTDDLPSGLTARSLGASGWALLQR